ncbi:MAG: DNA polymerase III subunit chi [Ponticaulis sp.]|nr:DNA polymerase III subunit chi [Ponticaulis sp.]|tara:strand:+ start:187 stop:636 length:450 start_codon:yes stop_codon:yes gene_type:complete
MACEWWFYHLERPPLAAALAPLFEKCLERGWRVLVSSDDSHALDEIDAELWNWRDDSFLPHGRDGELAEQQPVLLTTGEKNLNNAKILVLLGGKDCGRHDPPYERVMVVFEDGDGAARGMARTQYKRAKDQSAPVRYFRQTSSGGWQEQ